jgi:tyrosine-protein phosphatase YwqE
MTTQPNNQAYVIASMDLVSRTATGYEVTTPQFAGEVFTVTKRDGQIDDCIHIQSVRWHVKLGKSLEITPKVQQQAKQQQGSTIKPKQLTMIRIRCAALGLNADALCQEWYRCDVSQLRGRAIQAFIDRLKNTKTS